MGSSIENQLKADDEKVQELRWIKRKLAKIASDWEGRSKPTKSSNINACHALKDSIEEEKIVKDDPGEQIKESVGSIKNQLKTDELFQQEKHKWRKILRQEQSYSSNR